MKPCALMQIPNGDLRHSCSGSMSRFWTHAVHNGEPFGQSHGTYCLAPFVTIRGPASRLYSLSYCNNNINVKEIGSLHPITYELIGMPWPKISCAATISMDVIDHLHHQWCSC